MGEIRFVGTGDTRGYPYLVCKKKYLSSLVGSVQYTCPVVPLCVVDASLSHYVGN